NVKLEDVLDILIKDIKPEQIQFIDYISNKYGIWVDSSETVSKLMDLGQLTIHGQDTEINAYCNPIRTITLRGVPPFIPDEPILKILESYGKKRSQITQIKQFLKDEKYSHILSFTRTFEMAVN